MANYAVFIEGLDALTDIQNLDERVTTAARQAVNAAAERARSRSAKAIAEQVAFPAGYLAPSKGRLAVVKKASNDSLESIVRGQQRPTMLARFMKGSAPGRGKTGVTVTVKPGTSVRLPKAFAIKLPGKPAGTETLQNLGIAVRLKPGETLRHKSKKIANSRGLHILYGPSVDQVFRSVAEKEAPKAAEFLEAEFGRLVELRK